MSATYIPGSCNIGRAEIRNRYLLGWGGFVATLAAAACLIYFKADPLLRLLLIVPAELSALGFFQALGHFCAAYGLLGVFNVGPDVGKTDTVEQAGARKKDQLKALQIILLSSVVGVGVAAVTFFLPL